MASKKISTGAIKDRLRNLRKYLPNQIGVTYDFAGYLAKKLDTEIAPEGFSMTAESVLSDLKTSASRSTRHPVQNGLFESAPIVYAFLRTQVPEIADAVCPADFALRVRDSYAELAGK